MDTISAQVYQIVSRSYCLLAHQHASCESQNMESVSARQKFTRDVSM